MDLERKKRRQSIRIIISETIMVIAVVIMVTILAFLVSGYWINSNFELERQGLLQISSMPTGANINIDDENLSWLQRTNTSKVLPVGEHKITLSKEGYDSWSKTINISEGLLYRIHYPRLFPNDRTEEKVLKTSDVTLATVSPDHNYLLLINNTNEWSLINLDSENINPIKIDVSGIFSSIDTTEKTFSGEILNVNWDYDGNHVLIQNKINDATEWVLLDVKNTKNSVNITKEFAINFSEIQILDNSSSNLLAIQDNNLRKINIPNKNLSNILVKDVTNFDHYNNDIIFSTKNYIGLLKINDDKTTKLTNISTHTKAVISKFYDDKYITTLQNNLVSLYKQEDFTKLSEFKLSFSPEKLKVGHNGEFIIMYSDSQIATLDMESMSIIEWNIDGDTFGWIDNDMIYTTPENELIIYDYDGLNRRIIAKGVATNLPAMITNDKWLYYFSDNSLIRESLLK